MVARRSSRPPSPVPSWSITTPPGRAPARTRRSMARASSLSESSPRTSQPTAVIASSPTTSPNAGFLMPWGARKSVGSRPSTFAMAALQARSSRRAVDHSEKCSARGWP